VKKDESVDSLQVQLASAPVTALGVILDLVAVSHTDPLGDRSVLALCLGEHTLDLQRFVGGLERRQEKRRKRD